MKKRLTAWLVTLSMLLTVLSPLTALAADDFDEDIGGQYPEDIVDADDVDIDDFDVSTGIATYSSGLSLTELRAKFPAGKYWNHAGNPGTSSAVNNQDGWTNTPCPKHKTVGTSEQTCNGFAPDGTTQLSHQCMGYAEKLGYDATGYNPRNNAHGWSTSTSTSALNTLKPGDIVRFQHGSNPHSIYVTGVNGNTITYTDCNSDGHCIIRWGVTMDISTLRNNLIHVRSAPFAMAGGSTNRLPEGSLDNCEGGAGYVHVRGWSFDWDSLGTYIAIHVYIDGTGTEITANVSRPDILSVYPDVGKDHGFDQNIPASAGKHTVTVYAIDNEDPSLNTVLGQETVTVSAAPSDTTGPEISSCTVTQKDSNGYTLTCIATDPSGVDRVEFRTWTTTEGQANARIENGTRNGNTFTYRVKKSDHGNATSGYMTYVIAYDKLGNWSGRKLSSELSLPIDATGISLNKTSLTFNGTGSTQALTATVSPSNATDKTVTWSSSNTSVATVSGGTVKAIGYGTATITAKTSNGKTATCTVTVKDTTAPVFASAEVVDVDSFGYTVRCKITDNRAMGSVKFYTWTTAEGESKASVVTVTPSSGVYSYRVLKTDHNRAVSGYTTRVDAYDTSGNKTSRTFANISIPVGVDKVTLSTTNMTLIGTGATQTITATITPSNAVNHTIRWSSSNTGVATVSGGTVKATGYGTATITATASNGVTATCKVTVVQASLTGISVASKPSKTSYTLGDVLNTSGLSLKATYNNGKTSTITSGFSCTPTTLNAVGTQTITVNYGGKTTSFTVTVGKPVPGSPTGLVPGTYLVRYAATSSKNASTSVEITVPAFTASFQPITLTFDATYGTLDITDESTKTVYRGETYDRLPEPTAVGYVFTGWYTSGGKRIKPLDTCDLTQSTTVQAHWEPASAPGYEFNQNTGTLTIDCSGAMEEFVSAADTPWYSYRDSIRTIVVRSGVTALSSYAFSGCENLVSVVLPDTLHSIGTMAFYDCDKLTSIVIPASVTSIGSYAFADDDNLAHVTFEGDAPAFGTGVFTVGSLEATYPVFASGWETVVGQQHSFGGSIRWTRSSTATYSMVTEDPIFAIDDTLSEEPALYDDAMLSPEWTL